MAKTEGANGSEWERARDPAQLNNPAAVVASGTRLR